MAKKTPMSNKNGKLTKEIRQIRNLLILIRLKSGATSDEEHYATGMGAANIRRLIPANRGRRGKRAKQVAETEL